MKHFSWDHLATILKYGGISFIAGAVNHGFFSEWRSLWTAIFGVLFYLVGAWIDIRQQANSSKTWGDVLGAGIVFSIGIGFFTGGLQHFPDSPERSVWVVPLGFVLSVVAMRLMRKTGSPDGTKSVWRYGVIASLVVTMASVGAWQWLAQGAPGGHDHGGHSHGSSADNQMEKPMATPTQEHAHDHSSHSHAATDDHTAKPAIQPSREITIEMGDDMRFVPQKLQVKQHETIRFVVINRGKLRHEWVIGNEQELKDHALQMKKAGASAHQHDMPNAVSVAGGGKAELVWTFTQAGQLAMACFEPGHYEAGMRGTIEVAR